MGRNGQITGSTSHIQDNVLNLNAINQTDSPPLMLSKTGPGVEPVVRESKVVKDAGYSFLRNTFLVD